MAKQETQEKQSRNRNPAHPAVALGVALDKAETLRSREGRKLMLAETAAKHWGSSLKSSSALQAISALKQFGLLVDERDGRVRKVRLSELALRILLDRREESLERLKAIQEAALRPKVYADLWSKAQGDGKLPSSTELEHYLMLEREQRFYEDTVKGVIKDFRSTIAFAKLGECDIIDDEGAQAAHEAESPIISRGPTMPTSTIPESRVIRSRREPSRDEGAAVTCDLPGGNLIEIRLRRKVSPSEFEHLKKVFEIAEFALVDHDYHPNLLDTSDNKSTEAQSDDNSDAGASDD